MYANPDGSYTADDFNTVVNYQDPATHQWRRIQPALTTAADGGIHNTAGPVQETFAASTSDAALLTLASGSETATLGMPAGLATTTGSVSGNTVSFSNVAPGLSLSYQSLRGGVEELMTLAAPPTSGDFSMTFPLHTKGLRPVQDASGNILLEDAAGTPVFTIPDGVMDDSSSSLGTSIPASYPITQTLAPDGSSITVTASGSWLRDPSRVYPVQVDPSINLGCGNGCYDAFVANASAWADHNFNCTLQGSDYANYEGYSGTTFGSTDTLEQMQDSYIVGTDVAAATWYGYFDYTSSSNMAYWLSAIGGTTQWTATGVTWNNKDPFLANERNAAYANTGWDSMDITYWVQAWAEGIYANHGLQVDENGRVELRRNLGGLRQPSGLHRGHVLHQACRPDRGDRAHADHHRQRCPVPSQLDGTPLDGDANYLLYRDPLHRDDGRDGCLGHCDQRAGSCHLGGDDRSDARPDLHVSGDSHQHRRYRSARNVAGRHRACGAVLHHPQRGVDVLLAGRRCSTHRIQRRRNTFGYRRGDAAIRAYSDGRGAER